MCVRSAGLLVGVIKGMRKSGNYAYRSHVAVASKRISVVECTNRADIKGAAGL